jgi:hypothetical protein
LVCSPGVADLELNSKNIKDEDWQTNQEEGVKEVNIEAANMRELRWAI